MGTWSTSITGNDTAADMRQEYCAAFYKYPVDEALAKIDSYVRKYMCDERDAEEFCDYYYSLADFMWKKGILTDEVRDKAIAMIDSKFGLDIWAESGEKTLRSREKVLSAFREKLLSPQPRKNPLSPMSIPNAFLRTATLLPYSCRLPGKNTLIAGQSP